MNTYRISKTEQCLVSDEARESIRRGKDERGFYLFCFFKNVLHANGSEKKFHIIGVFIQEIALVESEIYESRRAIGKRVAEIGISVLKERTYTCIRIGFGEKSCSV